jgi:hypothetical protein
MRRLRAALGAALVALSVAATAHAFTHIVQPGETLAAISERFYGKVQNETLLVVANGLDQQGGIPIVPGMRLEVPAISYVEVTEGQSWKQLALRLLGGEHRAHVLAEANGSKAWLPPDINSEISVPYNLRFVATGEETIVGLAYRFQGDRKLAWQLDQYNARGGRRLERGEVVLIPLSSVVLTEPGKQAAKRALELDKQETRGQAQSAQKIVALGLPELSAHVRNARYVEALEQGTRFLSLGDLTKPQLGRIHRLLLEAHAALSVVGRAAESCSAWFKFDPHAALDPVQMSPKLIAACEVARVVPDQPEPSKSGRAIEAKP